MTPTKRSSWVYDIESFHNFFGVCFVSPDGEQIKEFVLYRDRNDIAELTQFIKEEVGVLIGYNNHAYDCPLIDWIISHPNCTAQDIHTEGTRLIKRERAPWPNYHWVSVDLFKMMYHDVKGISLKQTCINMQWDLVQDLPLHHTATVKPSDVDEILKYGRNDTTATREMFLRCREEFYLRRDIGKYYGLGNKLLSRSRSGMADTLFTHFWCEETDMDPRELRSMGTDRGVIAFADCLSDKIEFETPVLKELLEKVKLGHSDEDFSHRVLIDGLMHSVAKGGLHSENRPAIYEQGDDYELIDADVSSYYPNILIKEGIFPAHLGVKFLEILSKLTKERLDAKKLKKDPKMKLKAEALKITINAIYGKLGSDFSYLRDKKALYSVTLRGQLYLLMLIEKLSLAGIPCIYSNTDGITCKVHKDKKDKYFEICNWWQELTGFELEFEYFSKMILRDVNNFIMNTTSGDVKTKGALVDWYAGPFTDLGYPRDTRYLSNGYNMPIVPKAVRAYFLLGIRPEEYLRNEEHSILDFCIAQKTGHQFRTEFHYLDVDNAEHKYDVLQKNNRYYVSTDGGKLYKRDKSKDTLKSLVAGYKVSVLNKYDPAVTYDNVNYQFYESQVWKIINVIHNNFQTSLF